MGLLLLLRFVPLWVPCRAWPFGCRHTWNRNHQDGGDEANSNTDPANVLVETRRLLVFLKGVEFIEYLRLWGVERAVFDNDQVWSCCRSRRGGVSAAVLLVLGSVEALAVYQNRANAGADSCEYLLVFE